MAKSAARKSSSGKSNSNLLGAVAYLFGFVSGVILYLFKRDDTYVRFHSMQSMMWFVLIWVVSTVLTATVIGIILVPLVGIVALVSWLWLMYKALTGEKYMLPYVGKWAEKYA